MATDDCLKLDFNFIYENLSICLVEEDDVNLESYVNSYKELNKFFTLMGTVFGFVSKDLREKTGIIANFLKGEQKENFKTVKSMIEHEKSNELLEKKNYVSGSRTLLRLHRGLDFIREFLKNVHELNDEDNVANICREAYDRTLAKYHPFLIRKGAKVAMYALPTRIILLKKICGDDEEAVKQSLQILPKALEVTGIVYERIENLYTLHDLHSLP